MATNKKQPSSLVPCSPSCARSPTASPPPKPAKTPAPLRSSASAPSSHRPAEKRHGQLDPALCPNSIFDPTDPTPPAVSSCLPWSPKPSTRWRTSPNSTAPVSTPSTTAATSVPTRRSKAWITQSTSASPIRNQAAKDAVSQGTKQSGPAQEHARSIRKPTTLDIDDFGCRFLIVQTGFQKSAEAT